MKQVKKKIVNLIKQGKFKCSPSGEEYFKRAKIINFSKNADFTIVDAKITFWGPYKDNEGGMEISWSTVSAGFGILTVYKDKNGKLKADTECMSEKFCKTVIDKAFENVFKGKK